MEEQETAYGLGKLPDSKNGLWIAFTSDAPGEAQTWQLQVSVRGRGGKLLTPLLATSPLRPLATVTLKGEAYPLTIGWHERKRGGVICLGGERKTGLDGGRLAWEMRWTPDAANPGRVTVEMRLQATPRRVGDVTVSLYAPLHRPELWALGAAAAQGYCAQSAFSAYGRHALQFVALEEDAGWDESRGGFEMTLRRFPLGGGKLLRFGLGIVPGDDTVANRAPLVRHYARLADSALHPLTDAPLLDPAPIAAQLSDSAQYAAQGAERLYLKLPLGASKNERTFHAGFPHYPLEALTALWNWQRFHPNDAVPRLVRYGASGVAADFQIMGRDGEPEPNKGAFWDKLTGKNGSDHGGGPTHGIASNARIARSLFQLHAAVGEPLLSRSALNICQWLLLKMNDDGYFAGDRVLATRGCANDGRVVGSPCSLDGVEAIPAFVQAFRATRNEVFIKAAWKVARHLLDDRLREFEGASPPEAASVIRALIALDAEAAHPELRAAIESWGAWLRALPLPPGASALNADGGHSGLFDCAQAGLSLFALNRNPSDLRYAFSCLSLAPPEARGWHDLALAPAALLSLAALVPDARPDFDALSVTLDWRVFAPDAATEQYVTVQTLDGLPVPFLPLVCRGTDQLMLLILASRETETVSVRNHGRRPILRDLRSGALTEEANLHSPMGESWARVGLFTIDP